MRIIQFWGWGEASGEGGKGETLPPFLPPLLLGGYTGALHAEPPSCLPGGEREPPFPLPPPSGTPPKDPPQREREREKLG